MAKEINSSINEVRKLIKKYEKKSLNSNNIEDIKSQIDDYNKFKTYVGQITAYNNKIKERINYNIQNLKEKARSFSENIDDLESCLNGQTIPKKSYNLGTSDLIEKDKGFYNYQEVKKTLGVANVVMNKFIKSGNLKSVKGKITKESADKFIEFMKGCEYFIRNMGLFAKETGAKITCVKRNLSLFKDYLINVGGKDKGAVYVYKKDSENELIETIRNSIGAKKLATKQMTIQEMSDKYGVPYRTIYNRIQKARIKGEREGGAYYYSVEKYGDLILKKKGRRAKEENKSEARIEKSDGNKNFIGIEKICKEYDISIPTFKKRIDGIKVEEIKKGNKIFYEITPKIGVLLTGERVKTDVEKNRQKDKEGEKRKKEKTEEKNINKEKINLKDYFEFNKLCDELETDADGLYNLLDILNITPKDTKVKGMKIILIPLSEVNRIKEEHKRISENS